jgi:glucosamine kinase
MDSRLILGIDGGGSKCRARIRDVAGKLIAEAEGGGANIHTNFSGAIANIVDTARQAAKLADCEVSSLHAGLGLAGLLTSIAAERIGEVGLPFATVTADNDAYAACVGAFGGSDGGIVIAGTGSIGFAVIGGARHIVGGWGFALGDHGSGAWLGHHAVRRAALAIDGFLQPSPLIESVFATVGRDRLSLTQWSAAASPGDYASLAPRVFEAATKGDTQGMSMVIEGATAISNLGRALLARGAHQLCLLGGLAKVYPPYLDADVRNALVQPLADAADGAIMMARRAAGLPERWA